MNENFKFSDALISSAKTHAWVPSDEAWAEIHRLQNELSRIEEQKAVALEANQNLYNKTLALQNQIDALNRDYQATCAVRDNLRLIVDKKQQEVQTLQAQLQDASSYCALGHESHDKLIALQTQVLAFISVSILHAEGAATMEQLSKVFDELRRLAVE